MRKVCGVLKQTNKQKEHKPVCVYLQAVHSSARCESPAEAARI